MVDRRDGKIELADGKLQLSRARCREILGELDLNHVDGKTWYYDRFDDPKLIFDHLHFKYLKDLGLISFSYYEKASEGTLARSNEWRADVLAAEIKSLGISRCEVARKSGRPPKIDEADSILTLRSQIWRYLKSCADESFKTLLRTVIPAVCAGVSAGLSFGWFNKLIH